MIQSKQDLRFYLEQDRQMNRWPKHPTFVSRIKKLLFPYSIRKYLVTLRKAEYYNNCHKNSVLYGWFLLRYQQMGLKLGYSIPLNTFGPGLSLPHTGTIVVNENARIGANCRLHVCVNIGSSAGESKAPRIGDNVYIGPGAILFGDIEIADNVTIGANATVNKECRQKNGSIN